MMAALVLVTLSFLLAVSCTAGPVVQLNNGGLLKGKNFTYNMTDVKLFLGVPYAKPPVGELRFKKPEPFPAWTGERNATKLGYPCPQFYEGAVVIGNEDCLNLDITVPGPTEVASQRPVMVWIHGGGYTTGSKDLYIGAPLAVHGDVIVVTINYRLGSLGFLADDKYSNGNFGLWDQRQALLWVQENIAQFGGDPDMVTIFGESAGSGSVSAQTLGQHNDGLFKRAIQESGTMYASWSWYLSQRKQSDFVAQIKTNVSCSSDEEIYECLRELSTEEILTKVDLLVAATPYFHPIPDNDFFSSSILEETHELSNRFDLMSGVNGQEGLLIISSIPAEHLENGTSIDTVITFTYIMCLTDLPLSAELCNGYLLDQYGLLSAVDDKERAVRLSYMLGEYNFNQDIYNGLYAHSKGPKATYAYYFTEVYDSPTSLWPVPEYIIKSADHADELSFVLGIRHTIEQELYKEYYDDVANAGLIWFYLSLGNISATFDLELTNTMMTAWTNFAISGDPNLPVSLPTEWPKFNVSSDQFLEFNSNSTRVISTPNRERVDALRTNLFSARRLQVLADIVVDGSCDSKDEPEEIPETKPCLNPNHAASNVVPSLALLFFVSLCVV